MNFKKICINEAIALFIIIIINQVILGVSKEIITDTASSAWLHTIFLSLLAFFLFFSSIFLCLYRRSAYDCKGTRLDCGNGGGVGRLCLDFGVAVRFVCLYIKVFKE